MRTKRSGLSLVSENVRMAFESLLSTKLRTFLTLLGILIGVGTVVAMVTIITGLGQSMRRQIAGLGSGVLYVSKWEAGVQINGEGRRRPRRDLLGEDAEAVLEFCPSVASVSAEIQFPAYAASAGVRTSLLGLQGVTEWFSDANSWDAISGRTFTRDEVRHRAPVCVLGSSPAELLFPHGGELGQWIDVDGRRLQIIGVLESRGRFLGQNQDDVVLVPLPLVAAWRGAGRAVDYFVIRPALPEQTDAARDEITELLRRRRGVRSNQPNDFGITSQENLLELYHQVTGAFFLVTVVISSIGLLVGGIGVMNMMLISVRERTREIGIRAAIGARRSDILGQFLTEAIAVTLVGGVLGLGLGYLLALGIHLAFKVPMGFSVGGTVSALVVSGSIGLFFGLYPAWRASRLDPIEALRFE